MRLSCPYKWLCNGGLNPSACHTVALTAAVSSLKVITESHYASYGSLEAEHGQTTLEQGFACLSLFCVEHLFLVKMVALNRSFVFSDELM